MKRHSLSWGIVALFMPLSCSSSGNAGGGTTDSGTPADGTDAATPTMDAGSIGTSDGGATDGGTTDGGATESGATDGGAADSAPPSDAGSVTTDGGATDASAPAATWTFGGGTANGAFTSGAAPSVVMVPSGGDVSASLALQFAAPSGGGSLAFTTAEDACCGIMTQVVSPPTLPADDATSSNNPVVYLSIYNAGSNALSFGATPAITLTPTSGGTLAEVIGADDECQLDVFEQTSSGGAWKAVAGASVALSPNTATVSIPSTTSTVDFPPGQSLAAISCD